MITCDGGCGVAADVQGARYSALDHDIVSNHQIVSTVDINIMGGVIRWIF